MKIIAVYDNGGKTFDRYTIYTNEDYNRQGTIKVCLALSDNPNHPQGFSQFSGGTIGDHNGKRIKFTDLPQNVQEHAKSRLT
jgi:hypothetical protein